MTSPDSTRPFGGRFLSGHVRVFQPSLPSVIVEATHPPSIAPVALELPSRLASPDATSLLPTIDNALAQQLVATRGRGKTLLISGAVAACGVALVLAVTLGARATTAAKGSLSVTPREHTAGGARLVWITSVETTPERRPTTPPPRAKRSRTR